MKIAIGIIGILLMGIILIIISKKRKEKKAKALQASDKIREEALDRLLLNQETESRKEEPTFAAVPIAVNYDVNSVEKTKDSTSRKKRNKSKKVMVQIVENSELSARKYMLDPQKGIFIGSKAGKNHIVISNANVDERQCEIRENAQKVYVRNTGSSGKVILRRGKQSAYVEQKYLELKTGDTLLIGNMLYRIDLIVANEK